MSSHYKIGVIGLGYVGLPLACLFATRHSVVGFDLKKRRVEELNKGIDSNDDIPVKKLQKVIADGSLVCTNMSSDLKDCNAYIVAVPTPVDKNHRPDLNPLVEASRIVGESLSPGNLVVFESTVFPGATEEVCAPIIESFSGLKTGRDYHLCYSPERINPGDTVRTVENITKITAGSTPQAAAKVDELYNSVLKNGTFMAASIKVAEAAKIIENTQRDINIAFMNEMTRVFDAMGFNVHDVIEAAGSKWNFMKFHPGLVGGHCIGVDPYYLIEKAKSIGVETKLVATAREINEDMSSFWADKILRNLKSAGKDLHNSRILLMGFSFKENCRDLRNTKISDLYRSIVPHVGEVTVFDPMVEPEEAWKEFGIKIDHDPAILIPGRYDAVIRCVNHDCYADIDLHSLAAHNGVVLDIRSAPVESPSASYAASAVTA